MRPYFLVIFGMALCATEAAAQPAPAANPTPITINNRTFLPVSDVYDPLYGIGQVGIVKDNILEFLPVNAVSISAISKLAPQPKNFTVFDQSYQSGGGGELSIPVIGSFKLQTDQILHITLEDISDVTLPRDLRPKVCDLWWKIRRFVDKPNTVVMFADHATFSKMTYNAADKTAAGATIGIGSYFSAGADMYKDAASQFKIPVISVTGAKFTVADPKTFCTSRNVAPNMEALTDFSSPLDVASPQLEIRALRPE